MQIKNVSPYGALDVPLLRRQGEPYDDEGVGCLGAGEVVDVAEDHARVLLRQAENYAPADDQAQAIADEIAAEHQAVEEAAAGVPASSALLAVWVAYAQSQGDADAASKTKKQLVAEYGDQGDTAGESA